MLLCQGVDGDGVSVGDDDRRSIEHQTAVDLVRQASAKGTDGLGLGVAVGHAPLDVFAPESTRSLELGDGDAVQSSIQLAIAAAVESNVLGITRPDRHRRSAVVASVGRL